MDLSNLTSEQLEKAKKCETPEEFFALAQSDGIELTDEQLEAVSGGEKDWTGSTVHRCPSCGSTNTHYYDNAEGGYRMCRDCGNKYVEPDFAPAKEG